jgi:hypothetical protein
MSKLYSYVLRVDTSAAPNPFWGICTLTICKPVIRKFANIGDWIIGTGSKKVKVGDKIVDYSNHIVYAMKVTDKKTMKEYDDFCKKEYINKIPNFRTNDWRIKVGDCIYDYSVEYPRIRKSVHNEKNRKRDMSGINSLISNNFYYFGSDPKLIPEELLCLIKSGPGHKKIELTDVIEKFENWISIFDLNRVYANPQTQIFK